MSGNVAGWGYDLAMANAEMNTDGILTRLLCMFDIGKADGLMDEPKQYAEELSATHDITACTTPTSVVTRRVLKRMVGNASNSAPGESDNRPGLLAFPYAA